MFSLSLDHYHSRLQAFLVYVLYLPHSVWLLSSILAQLDEIFGLLNSWCQTRWSNVFSQMQTLWKIYFWCTEYISKINYLSIKKQNLSVEETLKQITSAKSRIATVKSTVHKDFLHSGFPAVQTFRLHKYPRTFFQRHTWTLKTHVRISWVFDFKELILAAYNFHFQKCICQNKTQQKSSESKMGSFCESFL